MAYGFPTSLCFIVLAGLLAVSGCQPADTEKFEKIDLKTVFSTNGQKGVKEVVASDGKFIGELMARTRIGASNVFFVSGKSIEEAIKATHGVVVGGAPCETIALDDKLQAQVWMVVYWGIAGSGPPNWTIQAVERSEKTIRLHYRQPGAETADIHPYYVWIPIGKPSVGKYSLEMWDQETNENTLMRLCRVVEKKKG